MLPLMGIAAAKTAAASVGAHLAVEGGKGLGNMVFTRARTMLANGQHIRSLADYSRPARVEPIVMVEDSLTELDAMPDIMKSVTSLFIGYYLQAAVFAGTKVGTISPLKVLDSLNPNRDFNLIKSNKETVFSAEAWEEGLPSMEAFSANQFERRPLVMSISQEAQGTTPIGNAVSTDKYYEVPNLVIGKMIDVEIKEGEHSAKIPVLIRVVPTAVKSTTFTHIFTAVAKNNTMREQVKLWRAGQISFWRDLVFQTHLIDQHRRALATDTSNLYETITTRRRNNSLAASGGSVSMADASNIMVISRETAREIGKKLGGSIESKRVRMSIFNATYLLLLVIVDDLHERVTIFHRGYDQPTSVRFADMKMSEKGKGPDYAEILKAYLAGSTPNVL